MLKLSGRDVVWRSTQEDVEDIFACIPIQEEKKIYMWKVNLKLNKVQMILEGYQTTVSNNYQFAQRLQIIVIKLVQRWRLLHLQAPTVWVLLALDCWSWSKLLTCMCSSSHIERFVCKTRVFIAEVVKPLNLYNFNSSINTSFSTFNVQYFTDQ